MRPASQLSDYSPFSEQNVTELLKDSPAHPHHLDPTNITLTGHHKSLPSKLPDYFRTL